MMPLSVPLAPLGRVPDSDLHDLHLRISTTRWPRLPQDLGWTRGTDTKFLAELLASWRDQFDWRAQERRILGLPWEIAGVGDGAIRVVHQRTKHPGAPTVVLLHGWPDSVLRFERVLPLLDDVNVVVPALPGFPFGNEITGVGMNVVVMASLIADAMQALGYDRYVISGGDIGADIAEQLAVRYPNRVDALHLTNVSPLHAVFADRSQLDVDSLAYLDSAAVWQRAEGGYIAEQSTKPHTLAAGLTDSPAGLAAWITEKLQSWTDTPFEVHDLLTWISIYWFTGTIGTSFAPYVEFAKPVSYVATPTVLSAFAHDIKPAPRAFVSRFLNLQAFIEHENGGHFAAWEQPNLYVNDLRQAIALGQKDVFRLSR